MDFYKEVNRKEKSYFKTIKFKETNAMRSFGLPTIPFHLIRSFVCLTVGLSALIIQ